MDAAAREHTSIASFQLALCGVYAIHTSRVHGKSVKAVYVYGIYADEAESSEEHAPETTKEK